MPFGVTSLPDNKKRDKRPHFVQRDPDAVRLELWDDGKGFVLDGVKGSGIGLIGMKERADQIGATLEVKSEPGAGTRIVAVSRYQHSLGA